MPRPDTRKFMMADLMILVAGCAAGIAWTRAYYQDMTFESLLWHPVTISWRETIQEFLRMATPGLASIGMTLLVCRLRQPRPSIRRLIRQPGAVATASITLIVAFDGAIAFLARALKPALDRFLPLEPGILPITRSFEIQAVYLVLLEAGIAVMVGWSLLLVAGRWKAERTWIDRTGRCLGASWIAVYLINTLLSWSW